MIRRASRTLMGVLSVTTVVGISAYAIAHRSREPTNNNAATPNKASPVALMAVTATDAATPIGGATTKPSGDAKSQISNLKSEISNPKSDIKPGDHPEP